ncbi:MAG: FAD-dependent oxidoreductase [Ignavibacteriae bacterium]|nr:FAD-dependent oxidoreductase [Ignavibacteriota bacterium]
MIKELELSVLPDFINDYDYLKKLSAENLKLNTNEIDSILILKKSIDSRRRTVFRIKINVFINETPKEINSNFQFNPVNKNKKVIIIGSGPAGLFSALKFIESGVKPIIFERGKNVRDRRFDLKSVMKNGIVNEDSNYCFGEGGAGTYSDGKLYTRSNKRGNVNRILDLLIYHGANKEIAVDAHPHIGSNKLPKIIQNIRETILNCNGEIHFNSKVTDFILAEKKIIGVVVNNSEEYYADSVIVATGHSARDIYEIFKKHNLKLDAKPFAVGVRIEHPQELIDSIQYHSKIRHENLPAANYSLACQVNNKGVYSFCMCPGGIIIPASTNQNELVLNGMSVSKRNSPYANSGIVVEVNEKDWQHLTHFKEFAGLKFQQELEISAYQFGGGKQSAPAQRLTDFTNNKNSKSLPKSSYIPGLKSANLNELFPKQISDSLKKSLMEFNKKMKGFYTEEAQILAIESRTSSPIRIPRNSETLMHVEIEGLFPAGEGAGYAGGIVSAAVDGERCAEKSASYLTQK